MFTTYLNSAHFSYFLNGHRLLVDDEDPDALLTEGMLQQRLPLLRSVYVIIVRSVVAMGGHPRGRQAGRRCSKISIVVVFEGSGQHEATYHNGSWRVMHNAENICLVG
jgi:hypothetical protein